MQEKRQAVVVDVVLCLVDPKITRYRLPEVPTPVNDFDIVNKKYVDDNEVGITESAELTTTPVVDDTDQSFSSGTRHYVFFTLPATYKFFQITDIEVKSGAAATHDIVCGVDLVDANPPVIPSTALLCQTRTQTVVADTTYKLPCSSPMIRAGTIIGAFVVKDGAGNMRVLAGEPSIFRNRGGTYNAAIPNEDANAWALATLQVYLKIYYRGYK